VGGWESRSIRSGSPIWLTNDREACVSATAEELPVASVQKPTILVVEDNVVSRFAICDALRNADFRVAEATSAAEALTLLKLTPVDLLFLDLHLPGDAEGFAVARAARALQPKAKMIFTSARLPKGLTPMVEQLGPFIPKPYLIGRVLELMRTSLAAAWH
jgi:CheY-like chemotaxis protein